ncbi:MAG: helix-turn-helix domain-containing protein, partial [Cyanobacteria bacterium]|nr:helix-turn-helix domain-containing protein [Cyanobacteriota bacterium]
CPEHPGCYQDVSLTHQEIADLLGVARPTISSVLSELVKCNLIGKHKSTLCLSQFKSLMKISETGFKGLEEFQTQPAKGASKPTKA